MLASHKPNKRFDRLRRQAEELIQQNEQQGVPPPDDILELIHELKIHQAELEIQNEELKRAQQELSDLHRQYERLYEFAPCGYVTLDPQGIITRVNLTAVSLLESHRKYLLQSVFSNYIASAWQDGFLEARHKAARTGEQQRVEMQLKRKNGLLRWVRADIKADRDEREAVLQWRVVIVDVTREKEAETQIRKLNETLEQRVSERTAELEKRAGQLQQLALDLTRAEDRERRRFAAILHDDFQQEAAYIKIELKHLGGRADADMHRRLAKLAQFTGEYIEKMRHLSYALNPPALYRSGLFAALEALAKDMNKHHGLAVTLFTQSGAEPISSTLASILYRAVRELLYNVAKHAGVNTAVVDVRRQDKRIRIEVTDEGKGFDYPAIRAGQGGESGFGLYNIEDRMTFLGGTMQVASRPGKGSCIVLAVPGEILLKPAEPEEYNRTAMGKKSKAPKPTMPVARSNNKKQIRILLVEDHESMREALAELLQGHEKLAIVGEAVDGLEAIELAALLKPHVILMDVAMPKLDGIEATAHITRNHPDIRIIGLSMHNDDDTRQKMLDAGADTFLVKTDTPDKLFKTIDCVHRGPRNAKREAGSKA